MDDATADELNQLIRVIAIRHRGLLAHALAPLGLHPGQEILLVELAGLGACTQRALAAAANCEAPTITQSARKLEAAGLVVRRPSPHDGRVSVVELTDAGRAIIPDVQAAWRRVSEQALDGVPAAEIPGLLATLRRLAANVRPAGQASNTSSASMIR